MPRKKFGRNRKNRCRFCTPEGCPRPAYVDYKDVGLLKKLCTNQSKMFSRKRSGNCAAFQRASSDAVKRARQREAIRRIAYLRNALNCASSVV
ncbi:MAG: ribosomal protein [Planctomycetota bacterium]|nr:ribosomal protein [Planctomycetota bacterium]